MTIGDNIKKHRKAKGLTQQELSEMTGIAREQLSHYETGFMTPRIQTLEKISTSLNVSLNELMKADENKDYHLILTKDEMKFLMEMMSIISKINKSSLFTGTSLYNNFQNILDKLYIMFDFEDTQ
ncbi:MAG: helix-turn-helix domain-containing protein [Erysipelotrichaceae bacterium]|nr:helix-turn-helix domain-containing protein [Erysipelotrichaceae bacterium]